MEKIAYNIYLNAELLSRDDIDYVADEFEKYKIVGKLRLEPNFEEDVEEEDIEPPAQNIKFSLEVFSLEKFLNSSIITGEAVEFLSESVYTNDCISTIIENSSTKNIKVVINGFVDKVSYDSLETTYIIRAFVNFSSSGIMPLGQKYEFSGTSYKVPRSPYERIVTLVPRKIHN